MAETELQNQHGVVQFLHRSHVQDVGQCGRARHFRLGVSEAAGVRQTGCLHAGSKLGPRAIPTPHRPAQSKAFDCLAGATFAFLRQDLHAHW